MSRLDDHVSAVQNKLALGRFTYALAWGSVGFVSLVWVAVIANILTQWHPPKPMLWLYAGAAVTALASLVYAMMKRPTAREAAVAIDQKLGLKEKISTALFIRPEKDVFAQAAVRDAEETARNLVLNSRQHFPTQFPRPAYGTVTLAILTLLTWGLIEPSKLFGREEKQRQQIAQDQKIEQARKTVQKALATVEAMPKTAQNDEAIKLARTELKAILEKPINDPAKANRTAVKALQDVNESLKEQIKNSAKYAEAQNEMKMLRSMQTPTEGQGPISDAQRAIAKGEFTEAIDELSKTVDNFDKMDKKEQEKATEQMKKMADQLQQMANNPAEQKKMQQQLQNMGMNPQQAKQAQQLMQQAAQGDKQAQQQLQQMAQQAQQQMNNGQGPNPQQQQQIQQMMQQMQAQANSQQTAQQMAQAAQQMAQAMQQSQQAQQQQGKQPGQQQQQGMQQAMQGMQQQLQQMQAAAQDAQQIGAAQNAAQAAQADAQNAMNGQQGQGQNGKNGQWNPNGQIAGNGQPGKWNGQANPAGPNQGGIGAGPRDYKSPAPFSVKQEVSQSQDDEKGRILASNYIKDNKPFKGKSTQTLQDVAKAAEQEQTDEIDQERIGRQSQQVVKKYFGSMEDETPQPTPAPPQK